MRFVFLPFVGLVSAAYYSTQVPKGSTVFPLDSRQLLTESECAIYRTDYTENEMGQYAERDDIVTTALDTLKDIRGGNPQWYIDALDSLFLIRCEDNIVNQERYVMNDHASAKCEKQSLDFNPPDLRRVLAAAENASYCETAKNCYWDEVTPDSDRARLYTSADITAAELNNEEYAKSVVKYIAVCIVLGVLNFVFTLFYFFARCVFRCSCAGAKVSKQDSRTCKILTPIVFFTIFSLGICISGATANQGNTKVTSALDNVFSTINKGTLDLQYFFGTAARPLIGVRDSVDGAVNEAGVMINGSSFVGDDMDLIAGRLSSFVSLYQSTLDEIGAGDAASGVSSTLDESVGPIVASVDELLATLQTELVMAQGMIGMAADTALGLLTGMNDTIIGMQADLAEFQELNDSLSQFRQGGVLAMFAICLVFVGLGFVGVLSAFTPCKFDDYLEYLLHFTWMFGSLIGTFAFVLGGISITLAIGWSDMCAFMDIVTQDFSKYLGPQAGLGLNACFNNTPLMEAFNMTKQLDFAAPLEAQLAGISDMDVAGDFGVVKAPILELGWTISNINKAPIVHGLNNLTNLAETMIRAGTPYPEFVPGTTTLYPEEATFYESVGTWLGKCCYDDHYTVENVLEPWVANAGKTTTCFSSLSYARQGDETAFEYFARIYSWSGCDTQESVNQNILNIVYGISNLTTAQEGMLANLGTDAELCSEGSEVTCPTSDFGYDTTILDAMDDYESKMIDLVAGFGNMGTNLVGSLITSVEDFSCNMKCGFLADFYHELNANWCTDLLAGFIDISLSMVLLALFNIPVCICAAVLVNRFRGKWRCGIGSMVFAGADQSGTKIGSQREAGAEIVPEDATTEKMEIAEGQKGGGGVEEMP